MANTITTNTSYNGDYLTVDLDFDYTRAAKEAADRGDYTSAAKYEAQRNAKVNYLNSTGNNPKNYQITSDYVKDYGFTNNRGGQTFTDNASSVGSLKGDWKTGTVNGVKYTRDDSGKIYGNGYLVGDGVNPTTGEFTYSNSADAKKAAQDRYMSTVVLPPGLYGDPNFGLSSGYADAVQNGTVGDYLNTTYNNAPGPIVNQNRFESSRPSSSPTVQTTVNENSFETNQGNARNAYLDGRISGQQRWRGTVL